MKVKSLLNKITENWVAKICCVLAAILLYLFCLTARVEKKIFAVPLTINQEGTFVNTNTLPGTVLVTVRAANDKMPEINAGHFKAGLDLSFCTEEGPHDIKVNLELAPDIIFMDPVEITVEPESLRVNLEEKIRRSVPVVPTVAGDPAHGYEIKEIKVTPDYAVISGPASIVNTVKEIPTEEVTISNGKDNFYQEVKLQNVSRHVKTVNPLVYNVGVTFQASLVSKDFKDCPVYFSQLDPKLKVDSNVKVNFTVNGAELIIEKFLPAENTVMADCSGITVPGEYELPVVINVQDSLKIQSQSIDTIKILIEANHEPPAEKPVLPNGE